jgi:hydroxypyruvate reductase
MTVPRDTATLRDDAVAIWQAGVDAVRPERLLPQLVEVSPPALRIAGESFELARIGRILVVGAGKAGAAMALALEVALGDEVIRTKQVGGLVNVPDDCVLPTRAIGLHAARPGGINEPTEAGVAGTEQMLQALAGLGPDDLCLALISGGGSALLPAPVPGFTLADKQYLTRELSARGATIEQLNTVRRGLSRVKGGGLAAACRAGHLIGLVLSDVLGDDLATIASGPTVPGKLDFRAAGEVLRKFELDRDPVGRRATRCLQRTEGSSRVTSCAVRNIVIGNNALAVDAAGMEAERRGYSHAMMSAARSEGPAEEVGAHLAGMLGRMRRESGPDCLITGGEPTVRLAPAGERGLGGRNQQLALAALVADPDWQDRALVSGGTDGEDGPTDAAGAVVDAEVARRCAQQGLDPNSYLRRDDAYHFFEATGGLLRTGPTHTNVCDLRVGVVGRVVSAWPAG